MKIGIDSFAAAFEEKGRAMSPAARLPHLIEQIENATRSASASLVWANDGRR